MFWYKVLDGLPQSTEVRIPHRGNARKLKVFLTSVTDSQSFVSGIVGFFSQSDSIFSSTGFQQIEKSKHDPFADFGWKRERSKKILIAADSCGNAQVLKAALHAIGYEFIAIANSSCEMIDKYSIINPNWVFVDYILKNGDDGIELARTLKNEGAVSIVFTSVLFEEIGVSVANSGHLKAEELKKLDTYLLNSE
jgi:CheY-like chemotaxis protein